MKKIKPIFGWIIVGRLSNAPLERIGQPYGKVGLFSKRKFARNAVCWSPEQAKTYRQYYRVARIKISEI